MAADVRAEEQNNDLLQERSVRFNNFAKRLGVKFTAAEFEESDRPQTPVKGLSDLDDEEGEEEDVNDLQTVVSGFSQNSFGSLSFSSEAEVIKKLRKKCESFMFALVDSMPKESAAGKDAEDVAISTFAASRYFEAFIDTLKFEQGTVTEQDIQALRERVLVSHKKAMSRHEISEWSMTWSYLLFNVLGVAIEATAGIDPMVATATVGTALAWSGWDATFGGVQGKVQSQQEKNFSASLTSLGCITMVSCTVAAIAEYVINPASQLIFPLLGLSFSAAMLTAALVDHNHQQSCIVHKEKMLDLLAVKCAGLTIQGESSEEFMASLKKETNSVVMVRKQVLLLTAIASKMSEAESPEERENLRQQYQECRALCDAAALAQAQAKTHGRNKCMNLMCVAVAAFGGAISLGLTCGVATPFLVNSLNLMSAGIRFLVKACASDVENVKEAIQHKNALLKNLDDMMDAETECYDLDSSRRTDPLYDSPDSYVEIDDLKDDNLETITDAVAVIKLTSEDLEKSIPETKGKWGFEGALRSAYRATPLKVICDSVEKAPQACVDTVSCIAKSCACLFGRGYKAAKSMSEKYASLSQEDALNTGEEPVSGNDADEEEGEWVCSPGASSRANSRE